MPRRILFLLAMLAAWAAAGLPRFWAQDNQTASLRIVSIDPFPGQPLALDGDVTFHFNRRIDCGTSRAAFRVEPFIDGSLGCDGYSLTFSPAGAYPRGTAYVFELAASVAALDGASMPAPYRAAYTSVGFLQVSEILPPAQAQDVPTDSDVTIVFDRPVVPLLMTSDRAELPQPLQLSPAVDGAGEWVNSSVYVFSPSKALRGNANYTASIAAGLQAPDGSILASDLIWSFQTAAIEIVSIDPSPADDLPLKPRIQVRFNQVMDEDAVETAFYFRPAASSEGQNSRGRFEWAEDRQGFMFKPDLQLQPSTAYEIGLNSVESWSYTTAPLPSILRAIPADGDQDVSREGFEIFFASPMNIDTLADKISIEPAPDTPPRFYYDDWDDSYWVSFDALPSTDYTIQAAPGMEDIYGHVIDQGLTFRYATAPRPPAFGIEMPGEVGFYNAYRQPTQLYIYHRGVEQVDVRLHHVPIHDWIAALIREDYAPPTEDYRPRDGQMLWQWRIESNAPPNDLRYERLSLGLGEVVCPGAPPPRLKVGDTAIVATESFPLRARPVPADGEPLELLYRGYALPVIAGPRCAGSWLWWQVELRDGRAAWVAEGDLESYFLTPRSAASLAAGQLTPGLYFLEVVSPGLEQPYWQTRHFLNVATAVLTVKQSINRITVWATDVQSGQPIIGETISLYDASHEVLASGATDDDGIVQLDIPLTRDLHTRFAAVLDSAQHFGLGYSDWTNGLEPYQFDYYLAYHPPAFQSYLYTDRPVYRPGQPVYFRGIVRSKDDVAYGLPDLETAAVSISGARGEIVYEQDLPLNGFGSFSGAFDLAPQAAPGAYTLSVDLPSAVEYFREGGDASFLVAEYRLPEYQVEIQPTAPQIVQGSTAAFELEGRYFFGGQVADAAVEYTVVAQPYIFDYQGEGSYDFADDSGDDGGYDDDPYGDVAGQGAARTDADGKALIEVPGDLHGKGQSQVFRLEAGLRGESGQTIFSSASTVIHQGLIYVGARAESYVGRAHEDSGIDIIAVDWDSQPVADQPIDVAVVERRWSSVQERDADSGAVVWTWDVEEIPVTSGAVQTDADGKARFTYVPPKGGIFKIIVSTRDAAGNEVRASTFAWVSDSDYVAWRQRNDAAIELIPERTHYSVGDRAQILIASPYQGTAEALVTIERGGVIRAEHITLNSNSHIYEFDILPEYAPNIYVSAFIVKALDEGHPTASYRMGMTHLLVDIEQKELKIDIQADRRLAAPQETVAYRLRVADDQGRPVRAEIGVALTDLAALSLRPASGPTLLESFYGPQGLALRTSSSLTLNADEITAGLAKRKGGGGGIFDEGILELRGEWIDTPYWNPSVRTDAAGEAVVHVRLPDNLTTWRLDARAVTAGGDGDTDGDTGGDTLVGQAHFDLRSARPLIIRPSTPRFFIAGDQARLAAVVHSDIDRAITARVSLENVAGLQLVDGRQTQQVTIPAKGRTRVSWLVSVDDVESVAPLFAVRSDSGEYSDASISPVSADFNGLLPVYRYESSETVGLSGILMAAGRRVEALRMPRGFNVQSGGLELRIDKSLATAVEAGLDTLARDAKRFRECAAPLISRLMPNIVVFRALSQMGLAAPQDLAKLDALASESLQELYARQRADGGWSWCSYPQSHTLTSAYALMGLAAAKSQGYLVDESVIERAQDYLRFQLTVPSLQMESWQLNRQAFLLYALAYSGAPDIARSATLFESRERLNLDATAFLASALHIINPADIRLDALAQFMLNRAVIRATGSFFEESHQDRRNGSTSARSTALALDALIKIRPASELLPNIVRHLVSQRQADGHWRSHQENAWSIIALTNWMLASGELQPNYGFQAAVNGETALAGLAMPANVFEPAWMGMDVALLNPREVNRVEWTRTAGPGAMYYTAHLTLDLPVPEIEPLTRGIEIARSYTRPGEQSPIDSAAVGETVQVRLRITAPSSLRYVVIEDFLPAGAEAVNPDLALSQQLGTMPRGEPIDPRRAGWGWWHFDHVEFRDEKAVIYASHLPRGAYEYVYAIRPNVEGRYNVPPPLAQELNFPEVYGRGAGTLFTIRGASDEA